MFVGCVNDVPVGGGAVSGSESAKDSGDCLPPLDFLDVSGPFKPRAGIVRSNCPYDNTAKESDVSTGQYR